MDSETARAHIHGAVLHHQGAPGEGAREGWLATGLRASTTNTEASSCLQGPEPGQGEHLSVFTCRHKKGAANRKVEGRTERRPFPAPPSEMRGSEKTILIAFLLLRLNRNPIRRDGRPDSAKVLGYCVLSFFFYSLRWARKLLENSVRIKNRRGPRDSRRGSWAQNFRAGGRGGRRERSQLCFAGLPITFYKRLFAGFGEHKRPAPQR